jgi:hypothetical protein
MVNRLLVRFKRDKRRCGSAAAGAPLNERRLLGMAGAGAQGASRADACSICRGRRTCSLPTALMA